MPVYMDLKLMVTSINQQVNIVQSASGRWTVNTGQADICNSSNLVKSFDNTTSALSSLMQLLIAAVQFLTKVNFLLDQNISFELFSVKSRCQLNVTTWFQCLKKLLWVPMGSQIRHLCQ